MIRNSLSFKLINNLLIKLRKIIETNYLFFLTTAFYLLIWVINPGRYATLVAFILFALVCYFKFNKLHLALGITYLVSTLISTGKSYPIQLIPAGIYNPEIYPDGYVIEMTIATSFILSVTILLLMFRDLIRKNVTLVINSLDILLMLFFIWTVISNLFGSRLPYLSLGINFLNIGGLVFYFYIRLYLKDSKKLFKLLVAIFSAFILFESLISFEQFIAKTPIGKSIEKTTEIGYFGKTIDEEEFVYRPSGTFDHANTLGMHMVFWLLFVFIAFLHTKKTMYLYLMAFGSVTLLLTLSRSAWLGFAGMILIILYIIEKIHKVKIPLTFSFKQLLLPIILVPLIFAFVVPRAVKSIYTFSDGGGNWRIEQIRASWQIVLNNPVFGVGSNMLVLEGLETLPHSIFSYDALDVHNWYLSIVANHGVIAFVIFFTFIVLSLKKISRNILINRGNITLIKYLQVGYLGWVVCFLIIGLFSANNGSFNLFLLSGFLLNNLKNE